MSSTDRDASSDDRFSFDISASSWVSKSSGDVAGVVFGGVLVDEVACEVTLRELRPLTPLLELLTLLPLLILAVSDRGVSRGERVEYTDSAAAGDK